MRLQHEHATTYEIIRGNKLHNSSFVTLTYNDENLPANESLILRDWQLFAKSLKEKVGPFRHYMCGEYGTETQRPHYHMILYGIDFAADRRFHKKTPNGDILYTSKTLDSVWKKGYALIGDVTPESCSYVAHYVLKKRSPLDDQYTRLDLDGTPYQVAPEFATMSRNPGIGHTWINTFMHDVYPSDEVVLNGFKSRPPKFYDTCYERIDPIGWKLVKRKRRQAALSNLGEQTPDRLYVREQCFNAKERMRYERDLL